MPWKKSRKRFAQGKGSHITILDKDTIRSVFPGVKHIHIHQSMPGWTDPWDSTKQIPAGTIYIYITMDFNNGDELHAVTNDRNEVPEILRNLYGDGKVNGWI